MDYHLNTVSETRHYLVNAIVHHLVNQMMETSLVGRADIHTRAHADGLQAFENLDILLVIVPSAIFSVAILHISIAALRIAHIRYRAQRSLLAIFYLFCHH